MFHTGTFTCLGREAALILTSPSQRDCLYPYAGLGAGLNARLERILHFDC